MEKLINFNTSTEDTPSAKSMKLNRKIKETEREREGTNETTEECKALCQGQKHGTGISSVRYCIPNDKYVKQGDD